VSLYPCRCEEASQQGGAPLSALRLSGLSNDARGHVLRHDWLHASAGNIPPPPRYPPTPTCTRNHTHTRTRTSTHTHTYNYTCTRTPLVCCGCNKVRGMATAWLHSLQRILGVPFLGHAKPVKPCVQPSATTLCSSFSHLLPSKAPAMKV